MAALRRRSVGGANASTAWGWSPGGRSGAGRRLGWLNRVVMEDLLKNAPERKATARNALAVHGIQRASAPIMGGFRSPSTARPKNSRGPDERARRMTRR